MSVILYHGRASTCSKKVRLSLYEKGIAFESRLLDLQKFEQHRPDYLTINPKGVVPTLVHDGRAIVESSIIIQYVDEAFAGPALSPADPAARAEMRLWLRFSDYVAYHAVYAPTWQYMRHRAEAALGEDALGDTLANIPTAERRERWAQMAKGGYSDGDLAEAVAKMEKCLDALQDRLSAVPWLAGEAFGLADIAVLPFADRIRNLRPELLADARRSSIAAWLDRASARPSSSGRSSSPRTLVRWSCPTSRISCFPTIPEY